MDHMTYLWGRRNSTARMQATVVMNCLSLLGNDCQLAGVSCGTTNFRRNINVGSHKVALNSHQVIIMLVTV